MPNNKALTVTELTREIKNLIESSFRSIRLEGEISGVKTYPSGHSYFTIKDDKAQIGAVIWKGSQKFIRHKPKDGDHVLCRGRISLYEKTGRYQFVIESMEPVGIGALMEAYEKLKEGLEKEGLFDKRHKKELPYIAWRVGIVTSSKGAVFGDMSKTIRRRFPGTSIVLAPVAVQGDGAAKQIASAIEDFNRYGNVDVLIVGRGGGSIEDLWPFNEEIVARAIFASEIPVVSAVGHEPDFTIADYVADVRAVTPTAGAELVTTPTLLDIESFISETANQMSRALRSMLESRSRTVDESLYRLHREIKHLLGRKETTLGRFIDRLKSSSPVQKLEQDRTKLADLQRRLFRSIEEIGRERKSKYAMISARLASAAPGRDIRSYGDRLENMNNRLEKSVSIYLHKRREKFSLAVATLGAVSPLNVLGRGYAMVTDEKGAAVTSSEKLAVGDKVELRFADGSKKATINGDMRKLQERLF